MSPASGHELVVFPSLQLTDGLGVLVALGLAFVLALAVVPPLIRKMRAGGMVGRDVNKASKPEVAEVGGIAALVTFPRSFCRTTTSERLTENANSAALPPNSATSGFEALLTSLPTIPPALILRIRGGTT